MPEPSFRLVCVPEALDDALADWARDMLGDGQIALLAGAGGLTAVDRVAHRLGLVSVAVVRGEESDARQEETVMAYIASLPAVWVAPAFSEAAQQWARERGPMTLLVTADAPLSTDERRRIERFVAALGRQSE